ncbi:MAG TPA: N-acetyltransferase [Acidimicrobiia bacterium]|jgi:predicted N-acetyltransferase YhbS|nr:N-acetyltransferase [Acidimicrobiia bacterium]
MKKIKVLLREESESDFNNIDRITRIAFGDHGDDVAKLITLIRASESYCPQYSYVAELEAQVVGHIMLSKVSLIDNGNIHEILTLSPLSVTPQFQNMGIGSSLVREVVTKADKSGEPLIVLEGSHLYYPRFGFELSQKYGISINLPQDVPPESAQVFIGHSNQDKLKGHVVYPPAFDHVAH